MDNDTDVDIIVVGGGSAGCAVAGRLAEHGALKVMLVEAGKAGRDINTRIPAMVAKLVMNPAYDWVLPVEPDASTGGQPGFWPAGKCLGGGSSINGMMYIRGHADDYDAWARLGARGWSYADCLPYFRRMESNPRGGPFHGASGPLKVSESRLDYPLTDAWMESAVAAGVPRCADLNGDGYQAIGVDRVQASQHAGNRWSSADAYVRSGRHGGRLQLTGEARVTRILVENGAACGVELRRDDGSRQTVRAARGVVISAGTMASPKLLMLSGIGPAGRLAAAGVDPLRDLPGVGQNLQDHVGLNVAWEVRGRSFNSDLRGLGPVRAGADYLIRRRGMLTAAISNAQALVRTRRGLSSPNIQIAFSPFSFDILPGGVRQMPKQSMVSMLVCVTHPGSRGTVALRSADPDDPPLIRHELLGDADDLQQICEGVELARRIMAQAPIAEAVVAEAKPGAGIDGEALRDWVRERAISCFHQVGTCRMGEDDMAVVTPELKVRGLEGLWVADCSVMPRQVGANTNATAIMIGDKAADHILADLGLVSAMAA
jgi:choline dehydrogenase